MNDSRICPLLSAGMGKLTYCLGDGCTWYVSVVISEQPKNVVQGCAITQLPDFLHFIGGKMLFLSR